MIQIVSFSVFTRLQFQPFWTVKLTEPFYVVLSVELYFYVYYNFSVVSRIFELMFFISLMADKSHQKASKYIPNIYYRNFEIVTFLFIFFVLYIVSPSSSKSFSIFPYSTDNWNEYFFYFLKWTPSTLLENSFLHLSLSEEDLEVLQKFSNGEQYFPYKSQKQLKCPLVKILSPF